MDLVTNRRGAIKTFGLAAGVAAGAGALSPAVQSTAEAAPVSGAPGATLKAFSEQLARMPRRRDYKTVPAILDDRAFWDAAALDHVMAYRGHPKQVWDQTELDGPWLNVIRNSVNTQVFAFHHADFLAVCATHGFAHLSLFDQPMWDKYKLAQLTGGKMSENSLVTDHPGTVSDNYKDSESVYTAPASIQGLMKRGVVFLACHNAIWEITARLIKSGANPDKLSHEAMAAELTNHLVPGVVLTPGIVAVIPELQRAGFFYIK